MMPWSVPSDDLHSASPKAVSIFVILPSSIPSVFGIVLETVLVMVVLHSTFTLPSLDSKVTLPLAETVVSLIDIDLRALALPTPTASSSAAVINANNTL